ncbi:MAG TPA: N-acetyl-1-D-myo-inositol-2-amino-2-deoxy-alpha-D-glucopyranoside deacetylase [Pseudonocardiaceae bacterium]|nr:N-acetyl-1-D-myo-inositol-2-amino-2-deoxy-alpha-D-glucopyranoside deacetylase [Pseudonocardiaceae bacterium]
MLVHAHPDDESSMTGATMASYAHCGATVVLVTCTRGEFGEIVAPELAGLRDAGSDGLAQHRETELAQALEVLGTARHHWLGGRGRWRDSGIPANGHPGAFASAALDEPVRALVEILRAERPQVVVTYDDGGGYGHPDHIQANRVTMAALGPAADPGFAPEFGAPWQVAKVYWMTLPRRIIQMLVDVGALSPGDEPPNSLPDEEITAMVDGREHLSTKVAALRAHRSQVDLENGIFALFVNAPEFAMEHYQLVRGQRGPGSGPHGWESDLFAGVDMTR